MTVKSKFTAEMVALMVATYDPKANDEVRRAQVAELAAKFKMSTRQVIGKLSTMPDVITYTPYAAKAPKVRKATNMEIVKAIAENIGSDVETLASLERSSKAALLALLAATTPVEVEAEEAAQDEASGD